MNYPDPDEVPAVWQVGDVILEKYEVKQVFTGGGMGLVYRVYHRDWAMDLAVKSPRPEFFQTQQHIENFEREAETWVNLGLHPHTVSCYYVRRLGGIPRIFTEFVEGGSLADWIRSRRLYEGGPDRAMERILDIAIQFAWGLHYAHEQGLVHQDVKPGNVLVNTDGTVKVTDFGLAKARALAGETPMSSGGQSILVTSGGMTPAYCSPEQANGKSLSRKTDIWSWAISVFEMFAGEPPCTQGGQVAGEVLESYLETQEDLEPLLSRMPERIANLLRHCFRREQGARPKDFAQIVLLLQEAYQQTTSKQFARQTPTAAGLLADSLNNRGVSLLDLGIHEKALGNFDKALRLDPRHSEAIYNRGVLLWKTARGTDRELVARLEEIKHARPHDWNLLYLLGLVQLERREVGRAVTSLEEASHLMASNEILAALQEARSLTGAGAGHIRTFEGHTYSVESVCMSSDGRLAISAGGEMEFQKVDRPLRSSDPAPKCKRRYTLRIWSVETAQCQRILEGHTDDVTSVCMSPDNRFVLSGSKDKTLRLWEIATGRCIRVFEGHMEAVTSVSLSSDNRLVLSGSSDKTLRLWDATKGQLWDSTKGCLRTIVAHKWGVGDACLSSDGRWALSGEPGPWGSENTILLWDTKSGKCLRVLKGHACGVASVCFNADNSLVLSGSGDKTLRLWETTTGRCLRIFEGHTQGVCSVCLSRDNRWALSGSEDTTVRLWNLATGRCVRTFEGHTKWVTSVFLSYDCRLALSGSWDEDLRLWDVAALMHSNPQCKLPSNLCRVTTAQDATDARARFNKHLTEGRAAMTSARWSEALGHARSARAIVGHENAATALDLWHSAGLHGYRWEFRDGWLKHVFECDQDLVECVCLSPDGGLALTAASDSKVRVWNAATAQCLQTFEGHTGSVCSIVLSHDRCRALSGSRDKTLRLWDIATGRCLRSFEGHTDGVESVCLSSDGRFALSGSEDKTLRLWNTETGQCLRTFEGHTWSVSGVCMSSDSKWALSSSWDQTLRLWDLATGQCLRLFTGHSHFVTSVCLSSDNRSALSGSWDETARLWDVSTGDCKEVLEGHVGTVNSVCLSPDNLWAVSAGEDKTVRLWDMGIGVCQRTFEGHGDEVVSVCISPDGRWVLSGSSDWTARLLELDWEFGAPNSADWDDDALPYLETFLTLHTPYEIALSIDRKLTDEEIRLALTRRGGKPCWNEDDFQELLYTLACAGYGELTAEGVRRKLEQMTQECEALKR